ncbi:hypothetical protein EVA_09169 [gut metagenome]|uniref:Uncharacterized protein n=1 Tax=gut metagenome TaxID=749906 RepID=J9G663_9ZZZZ
MPERGWGAWVADISIKKAASRMESSLYLFLDCIIQPGG